jgi:cell wall-associated NlpC family hydrolase
VVTAFDPRLTPARPDLAAKHLEGKVRAARYVEGLLREVVEPQAPLRRAPRGDAPLDTEALLGERITVYEVTEEGWAWGQLAGDQYVGWVPASALDEPGPEPTHRVCVLRTLVFPGPDIRLPPSAALPFAARLAIAGSQERFGVTAAGGYVPALHLAPVDVVEPDFVALAARFLGAPYLWGGKTSLGIDCSGLVQVALTACGICCPRDSDMQEQVLGAAIAADRDFSNLRRGDLVFWGGHVAIVRDPHTLIHANAHHMAVAIEPLSDAVARIGESGGEVTSVKRLINNQDLGRSHAPAARRVRSGRSD